MEPNTFKKWLTEMEASGTADPEDNDPQVTAVARQAQNAVKAAVAQGKNPIKAAQQKIASNVGSIPINRLGKIMPSSPDDQNPMGKMSKK